ncbi:MULTISPECIES: site-specific DNA-methyltransferase [unclassified Variovorax]|nr:MULTISPECIES: site-specific DNA-methyltransferase [unclassified Variovorax]
MFCGKPHRQTTRTMQQSDLFEPILAAYRNVQINDEGITNSALYQALNLTGGDRKPVGRAREPHNLQHRKVRWQQQTLRRLGLLERIPGQRGKWRLTPKAQKDGDLTPAPEGVALVAFSTDLGLAIWTRTETLAGKLTDQISAIITSPPYPLREARAYGNCSEAEYVDFICGALEPLLKNLITGGCIALNVSNDIFLSKSPARSMYVERLTLALHDRLGLQLLERAIWHNPTKPPGPTYWASIKRQQLNVGYEPVLIFCNDPVRCIADNRRVLQPHSKRHTQLLAAGGEVRTATYGDGAFKLRPGSFGNVTAGKIPKNVISIAHVSREVEKTRKEAKALGLPVHGALMPVKLAKLLVEFLTPPGGLVLDPFGGWCSTALACEEAGYRWMALEMMAEYAAGGGLRMSDRPGFLASFDLEHWKPAGAKRN